MYTHKLLVPALLIVAVLAACGPGNDSPEPSAGPTASESTEPTAEPTEPDAPAPDQAAKPSAQAIADREGLGSCLLLTHDEVTAVMGPLAGPGEQVEGDPRNCSWTGENHSLSLVVIRTDDPAVGIFDRSFEIGDPPCPGLESSLKGHFSIDTPVQDNAVALCERDGVTFAADLSTSYDKSLTPEQIDAAGRFAQLAVERTS